MGKKLYSVNPEIHLKETYIKHVWFLNKTIICNFIPAAFPQRVMITINSLTFLITGKWAA